MTSLKDVAALVREGNNATEEGNETLNSIDDSFKKFFKAQERDKLDRLEDRLEAAKAARRQSRGGGAAAAGIGLGAAASSMFQPGAIGKALGTALKFATGYLAAKTAYQALANVVAERVKTQRGLLRIEGKELQARAKAAQPVLKAERQAAQIEQNKAKQDMKARIAAAEKQYQVDRDKAAQVEKIRAARISYEQAQEKALRAREAEKELKRFQRQLKVDLKNAKAPVLRETLTRGRDLVPTTDDTVNKTRPKAPTMLTPDAIAASLADGTTTPAVKPVTPKPNAVTTKPPVDTPYDKLKAYSDADLERVGVKRVTGRYNTQQYVSLETKQFVGHQNLLDTLRADSRSRMAAPPSRLDAGKGSSFRPRNIALNLPMAAIDPVGAAAGVAIDAGLREGAKRTTGRVSKAFGRIARTFASVPFNAALLTLTPTAAGMNSAPGEMAQTLYQNMVSAVLSGDPKNVIAARAAFQEFTKNFGRPGDPGMNVFSPEDEALANYLLNANEQELKAFTSKEYTKFTGKQFRSSNEQVGAAYGSARANGIMGFIKPGEETSALDALAENGFTSKTPTSALDTLAENGFTSKTPIVVVNNNDYSDNRSSNTNMSNGSGGLMSPGSGMSAVDSRYERKYQLIRGFGGARGQVF